jgi:hypothetical protein
MNGSAIQSSQEMLHAPNEKVLILQERAVKRFQITFPNSVYNQKEFIQAIFSQHLKHERPSELGLEGEQTTSWQLTSNSRELSTIKFNWYQVT